MRTPHPHQHACIIDTRASIRAGNLRPLVMMPTGGGKTLTAAWIIQSAIDKGSRVIFLVPAISLVDQTVREFYAEGIRDVGVIQADHPMTDPTRPVQVASVQTLMRRQLPEADLVIVDEAHQNFRFVREWMAKPEWAKVPFIGLSATPWSKGLGRCYDDLIIAATTSDLIAKGFLSSFKVYAPTKPDLSKVRTRAGEFVDADASEAMQEGTLTADIVTTWLQRGENRPTLCFAVDRAHAAALQKQFEAADVPTGYIDANTPPDEREALRRAFAVGAIKVVCNVGVLTTGVDWDVRCIILARPTKSEILYTQIIGRGLRTAPGKDHCVILDHSDTTMRLAVIALDHPRQGAEHDGLAAGLLKLEYLRPGWQFLGVVLMRAHYLADALAADAEVSGGGFLRSNSIDKLTEQGLQHRGLELGHCDILGWRKVIVGIGRCMMSRLKRRSRCWTKRTADLSPPSKSCGRSGMELRLGRAA